MSEYDDQDGDIDIGIIDPDHIAKPKSAPAKRGLDFDTASSQLASSINSFRAQFPDIQGSIQDMTKDAMSSVEVVSLKTENTALKEKVASLESEMRILEKTARHAKELELELDMLSRDVSDLSGGVRKRGWLNRWHDTTKDAFIPKWSSRYFILQGTVLSYGTSDSDKSPWRTVNLQHCMVKYEGTKANGKFYVFAIYYLGVAAFDNPDISILDSSFDKSLLSSPDDGYVAPDGGSLLIRMSSGEQAEAEQWIELLHRSIYESSRDSIDLPQGSTFLSKSPSTVGTVNSVDVSNSSKDKPAGITANYEIQRLRSDKKLSKSNSSAVEKPKMKTTKSGQFDFPSSMPVHTSSSSSFLSSSSKNRQIHHYYGLIVLGIIILMTNHLRLIVENLRLYGVLVSTIPLVAIISSPSVSSAVLIRVFMINGFIVMTYLTEKVFCKSTLTLPVIFTSGRISVTTLIHTIIITASIFMPLVLEFLYEDNPLQGMIFLFISTITWMKLVSYAHCNADLRRVGGDDDLMQLRIQNECNIKDTSSSTITLYPQNLTLSNMYYFILAPTLSYQLNYPKISGGIRWKYIATILVRMVICSGMILLFVEQYVIPTVASSTFSIHDQDVMKSIELFFSLAIPNMYIWLLVFYLFFHLYLNLMAELMSFGDRVFYKDWWNARSIETFWRYWNLPVHHWFVRHLYFPAIRLGISKTSATFIIFLLSAIFHEVIISIPFRTVKVYAFLGMLAQAPLVVLGNSLEKLLARISGPSVSVDSSKGKFSVLGNGLFWTTFFVGQPMAVMLYSYDFFLEAHNRATSAKNLLVPVQASDDL